MNHKIVNTLGAVFALLSVAVAPAYAGSMVPFTAGIDGTVAITGVSNGSPTSASYGGTGVGSHIGAGRLDGTMSVTGVIAPGLICANGGFSARHTETLTAADGSKITSQVDETSCQTTPTSGVFHCVGTYSIQGGTGRFATATGSGTFDATFAFVSPTTGTVHLTYAGLISVAP